MKTSFPRKAVGASLLAACLSAGAMGVGCELAVQLDTEGIQGASDGSAPCPVCLDGAVVTEPDGNVVIVFGAAEAGDDASDRSDAAAGASDYTMDAGADTSGD